MGSEKYLDMPDFLRNQENLAEEHKSSASAPMDGYTLMPDYTQGVCNDGAAILRDGQPITPDEIVEALNALAGLVGVKRYKNRHGKDETYKDAKDVVWYRAEKALNV